jgi:primosomal replication protein N
MIKICPTTDSGLSHSDYYLTIKERAESANLKRERPQSVVLTLSGESVISVWQKYVTGTSFSVDAFLSDSEYSILRTIDEHASVFEWIIITQGRTFTAAIDVTSAKKTIAKWDVKINFVIISELHR